MLGMFLYDVAKIVVGAVIGSLVAHYIHDNMIAAPCEKIVEAAADVVAEGA